MTQLTQHKKQKHRRRSLGAVSGSWRWGIFLNYRRWINFQVHKAGLNMNDPFMFSDEKKQTWLLSAETIISVLIDAGENDERIAVVIYDGITDRVKRGEPMRRIMEHLGAWLIESGYLMRDGKSYVRRLKISGGQ